MRPIFVDDNMRFFKQGAQLVPFGGVGGGRGGEAVDEREES